VDCTTCNSATTTSSTTSTTSTSTSTSTTFPTTTSTTSTSTSTSSTSTTTAPATFYFEVRECGTTTPTYNVSSITGLTIGNVYKLITEAVPAQSQFDGARCWEILSTTTVVSNQVRPGLSDPPMGYASCATCNAATTTSTSTSSTSTSTSSTTSTSTSSTTTTTIA
jgi:hypothetical protein